MKKVIGLLGLGMIFMIALMSFSSAAYYGGYFDPYYGQGDYDSYRSYTTQTKGGFYGPRTTTTTVYDRVNEKYWDGRSWVDRTTYVREKRESPDCYRQGCYPGYNSNRYYGGYLGEYTRYGNYDYDYNYPRARYWY